MEQILSGQRLSAAQKARRAAADPSRPGAECHALPGSWKPVVHQASCEAKADCVDVCPYDVFEVRRIDAQDYANLNLIARLKVRVHGMQMAYTPRADECRACGLCVVACPEDAITIERTT